MRYAIYFTPPAENPLTRAGSSWLGRDVFTGVTSDPKVSVELLRDTTRYGFHGTLKAPFHLAEGKSEADLVATFDAFAREQVPFIMPKLVLGQIGSFFALVPGEESAEAIHALSDAAVRTFEPYRAPLAAADIARRNPEKLAPAQKANLLTWGYPYVLETFRFHMTLTDRIPEADQAELRIRLEGHFADLIDRPLEVAHVALFIEPERGAPFTLSRLQPLEGVAAAVDA